MDDAFDYVKSKATSKPSSTGSSDAPIGSPSSEPDHKDSNTSQETETPHKTPPSKDHPNESGADGNSNTEGEKKQSKRSRRMGGGAKLGVSGLALMGAGAAVDAFADEDSAISKVAHSDTLNYAATGAMIGGAAGSVIPVVGNAVGAAVGGAIGGAIGLYNDLTGGKEGGSVANQNIQVQNATIQANGNAAAGFAQSGGGTFTNADGQQVSLGADQNGRLAISQNGVTATTDIPANALQAFAGNPQGAEMLAQMMSSYAGADPSRLAQMLNSGFAENGGLTAQMQQNLSALSELRSATGTTLNGFGGSEIPLITNNQRMMDFAGVHTGVPASMMDTFSGPHAQMFAQAAGQLTPQQLQA